MERKLASIRRISDIQSIPGADAIEVAQVDGWNVVVKKREFNIGDLAVYFEIDSWIPHELAPFLSKGKEPREYNGIKGERLKTIKLRGQLSQGLLLPISSLYDKLFGLNNHFEGQDLTEQLGIQKWEKPIHPSLSGLAKGNFPSFIRKTDQERAQNLKSKIFDKYYLEPYEVTVKMDGSSITVFYNNGEVGICSRNLQLKIEENPDNAFVQTAINSGLINALQKLGKNIAVQGELVGGNIQGNSEKFLPEHGYQIFVFDIFDIDNQRYFKADERLSIMNDLYEHAPNLNHVPLLDTGYLSVMKIQTFDDLLKFADGPGLFTDKREGLVFKSLVSDFTFKIISNNWLLANE